MNMFVKTIGVLCFLHLCLLCCLSPLCRGSGLQSQQDRHLLAMTKHKCNDGTVGELLTKSDAPSTLSLILDLAGHIQEMSDVEGNEDFTVFVPPGNTRKCCCCCCNIHDASFAICPAFQLSMIKGNPAGSLHDSTDTKAWNETTQCYLALSEFRLDYNARYDAMSISYPVDETLPCAHALSESSIAQAGWDLGELLLHADPKVRFACIDDTYTQSLTCCRRSGVADQPHCRYFQ